MAQSSAIRRPAAEDFSSRDGRGVERFLAAATLQRRCFRTELFVYDASKRIYNGNNILNLEDL